jgi:NADH:ubiquinone oxidoreductase subunit 3 (subunit A)
MLCSLFNFQKEFYKYQKAKTEPYDSSEVIAAGASASFLSFSLVLATIFLVLEIIVLFYAISIALKCTRPGPERIVHIVLAITFTLPYVLLNVMFNKCAQDNIQIPIQPAPVKITNFPLTAY